MSELFENFEGPAIYIQSFHENINYLDIFRSTDHYKFNRNDYKEPFVVISPLEDLGNYKLMSRIFFFKNNYYLDDPKEEFNNAVKFSGYKLITLDELKELAAKESNLDQSGSDSSQQIQ